MYVEEADDAANDAIWMKSIRYQSANDWLYLYKKIQDAGKFVMAYVVPEEVEFLVRNLDPRLLYIVTGCKTKKMQSSCLLILKK